MIASYTYCGKYRHSDRLWGVVVWEEDGYTRSYVFWGPPKNPIIKLYDPPYRNTDKRVRIGNRIKEKRKTYSGYDEIPPEKIKEVYPGLDDLISMHMLMKKLKCSNTTN